MSDIVEIVDDYKPGDKTCHGGICTASIHITVTEEIYNPLKVTTTINTNGTIDLEKLEKIFESAKQNAMKKLLRNS